MVKTHEQCNLIYVYVKVSCKLKRCAKLQWMLENFLRKCKLHDPGSGDLILGQGYNWSYFSPNTYIFNK